MSEAQAFTKKCAEEVDAIVFKYGRLESHEPERGVLAARVREIQRKWSTCIEEDFGFTPGDLWKITYECDGQEHTWQQPCSRLVDSPFS